MIRWQKRFEQRALPHEPTTSAIARGSSAFTTGTCDTWYSRMSWIVFAHLLVRRARG